VEKIKAYVHRVAIGGHCRQCPVLDCDFPPPGSDECIRNLTAYLNDMDVVQRRLDYMIQSFVKATDVHHACDHCPAWTGDCGSESDAHCAEMINDWLREHVQ